MTGLLQRQQLEAESVGAPSDEDAIVEALVTLSSLLAVRPAKSDLCEHRLITERDSSQSVPSIGSMWHLVRCRL